MLRGLKSRLKDLKQSQSVDGQLRDSKRNEATRLFSEQQNQLNEQNATTLQSFIFDWDELLEKQMARAELETLTNLNSQKDASKRLQVNLREEKSRLKSENENATSELKKKLDDAVAILNNTKVGFKSKLESERLEVDNQMKDCREWVGIRTAAADLQNLEVSLMPESVNEVRAISDHKQILQQLENVTTSLLREIQRMLSQPVSRMLSWSWLLVLSPILVAIGAGVAWSLGFKPILVGLFGVVGAIVFTAVIRFASTPLLIRTIRRLLPEVVKNEQLASLLITQGNRIAEHNFQVESSRLEQLHATAKNQLNEQYLEKRNAITAAHTAQAGELNTSSSQQRNQLATTRRAKQSKINSTSEPRLESLSKQHELAQQELKQDQETFFKKLEGDFQNSQAYSVRRWMSGCRFSAKSMQQIQQRALAEFPPWDSKCYSDGNWPRVSDSLAWRLGEIQPLDQMRSEVQTLNLPQSPSEQPWSIFFDLLSHGALVLETHPECKQSSNNLIRNTLLRAVTSVQPGNLNITIIDPEGLGKQYSWLMSLADIDPALVNHRVWTQPLHISEQLANTARHVEDVIQQSLRDRFANLIEYNNSAGPMAVPYRLLVWSNFPFGVDDHSWQSLCSILSSGGKCGVGVILQVSNTYVWPTFADRSKLDEFGLRLKLVPVQNKGSTSSEPVDEITIDHPELSMYRIVPELPPSEERIQEIMEHQIASLANLGKRIVPFESIAIPESEQQTTSSAEGLIIPLGISDAGRVQSLKLGAGTAQHVLIAGKTGSGKSSLLHTIITSAAMKYSPEQLRLVLLDFKKGVEFQVYAETKLSHADIIGIESKREFGVSTLEYLDRVLHARGEAFRQWGIQDLPSLAKKYPQHAMPRILVLIDEFQELFVEDDKLSQQASMLMDRIVRQGRSFGIHLVLASQTLGGAYSLPRTTLSQMAVRIALHCDSSDAMLILSEDNTAAERLRHSGQAIYNDAGGRFESNSNFQVSYIEKKYQVERLGRLTKFPIPRSATTNALGRQIVFEGHKPAIWDQESIATALAELHMNGGALPMILGESISIDPPIVKTLSRSAGRNVMVVGQDESSAAALLAGLVASFSFMGSQVSGNRHSVVLLDGSRIEDNTMRQLIGALANSSRSLVQVTDIRSIDATMESLKLELERRTAAPDQSLPPMVIAIANISRFRELRRSEEYSFGEDSSGQVKPDAILANILRDGPALGMHVWIWADSAATITRWISRPSQRDIELRILMQMSASDSNQLIDTSAANKLDRYVALIHDDIEGKATKFRPFELQSVLNKLALIVPRN